MASLANINLLTTDLYNRWRLLLGEVIGADLDSLPNETVERMKVIHNKLALTNLTQERYLLAVTGLQGAGKTTLVKRLYNLDDEYLRDNDGRGEKVPILITESKVDQPVGSVYYSEDTEEQGVVIKDVEVEPDEFDRIAKKPKKNQIWLELKVPYKYFRDESKSLILLPGFEKDKTELSQQLLEHILHLSTSSVVVFRKDTFARANNIEMIETVKSVYGEVKPIYVLSHGDVNPENNETIIEEFNNIVQLDNSEKDRVVMSGDPTLFGKEWMGELVDVLGEYAFLTDESEARKMTLLENLFSDIRMEIHELEEFFRKQEEKAILNEKRSFEKNTYRLVEQFEIMYERVLHELERNVLESLEGRKEKAIKQFNTYVKENQGFWKGVINKFKPNALEQEEQMQAAIEEAWLQAGDNQTNPEIEIINVTTEYIESESKLLKEPIVEKQSQTKQEKKSKNRFKLDGLDDEIDETENEEKRIEINEKPKVVSLSEANNMSSLDRINIFFAKDREQGDIISLYREDLKALTLIGTMLVREGLYEKQLWDHNAAELGSREALAFSSIEDLNESAFDKTIDGMKNFSEKVGSLTQIVLKSIPLILGVDILLDGEADLILHATNALTGIGLTITPLQLLGGIGGAFALVYGMNAVQHAVHDANQRQLEMARAGRHAINQIPEIQTKAYIQGLRRVFEKMSDHLAEVHRERLGEYDNDAQIETIRYSLRRIKLLNNQLHKTVYHHAPIVI